MRIIKILIAMILSVICLVGFIYGLYDIFTNGDNLIIIDIILIFMMPYCIMQFWE